MAKINVLVSKKKWHKELFLNLQKQSSKIEWILIDEEDKFDINFLKKFKINKIFIPHWSHLIKSEIYINYECIVFHMTDLPYGRGGSPLQNLIIRNHKKTKISALLVQKSLDSGPVYIKEDLSLDGTAHEIFERSSIIIMKMINQILNKNIKPEPQIGKVTKFKRRTKDQSDIFFLDGINQIYDYIRMLDCEGYPKAFIESHKFKFEFSNAKLTMNNQIQANVRIFKK